jgi:hypothetical protein
MELLMLGATVVLAMALAAAESRIVLRVVLLVMARDIVGNVNSRPQPITTLAMGG